MPAYYNEFNPEAAHMLRQLIVDGHCAPGEVDERSITEVKPHELKGYTQCHFFAGIGGWQFALQQAGWPATKPVWTGSAPCQPFSSAGQQLGKSDERHLFPCWLGLIRECHPATIFGEQVANAAAHGWLDDVYAGLEAEGYAVGAAVLPACSVGAPHRRDRLWFVAHKQYTEGGVELLMDMALWATPSSRDWKDTPGMATLATNPDGSQRKRLDQLPRQAFGVAVSGLREGEKPGSLNPAFPCWLMGFSTAALSSMRLAMQSYRKLPRRS